MADPVGPLIKWRRPREVVKEHTREVVISQAPLDIEQSLNALKDRVARLEGVIAALASAARKAN
jgi:hypothetical protein